MTHPGPFNPNPMPAPGWYPAPDVANTERWWDGQVWADAYRPQQLVGWRSGYDTYVLIGFGIGAVVSGILGLVLLSIGIAHLVESHSGGFSVFLGVFFLAGGAISAFVFLVRLRRRRARAALPVQRHQLPYTSR